MPVQGCTLPKNQLYFRVNLKFSIYRSFDKFVLSFCVLGKLCNTNTLFEGLQGCMKDHADGATYQTTEP